MWTSLVPVPRVCLVSLFVPVYLSPCVSSVHCQGLSFYGFHVDVLSLVSIVSLFPCSFINYINLHLHPQICIHKYVSSSSYFVFRQSDLSDDEYSFQFCETSCFSELA